MLRLNGINIYLLANDGKEAGLNTAMKSDVLKYIGIASLILSLLSLILPWFFFIRNPFTTTEPFFCFLFFLYGVHSKLVFYPLSILAFMTGIFSRKNKFGKAGLIILSIILGYVIFFLICSGCLLLYMGLTGQTWF